MASRSTVISTVSSAWAMPTQDMPYLDAKELKAMVKHSEKTTPLKSGAPLATVGSLWNVRPDPQLLPGLQLGRAVVPSGSPANTLGHIMTEDGRLALRVMLDSEAQASFGVGGLSRTEAISLMHRIPQMEDLESAATHAQRDAVVIRRALSDVMEYVIKGELPPNHVRIKAASVLHTTKV